MKNVIGSIIVAVSLLSCSGAYAMGPVGTETQARTVHLCPDGTFANGICTLMPNGTYIGR